MKKIAIVVLAAAAALLLLVAIVRGDDTAASRLYVVSPAIEAAYTGTTDASIALRLATGAPNNILLAQEFQLPVAVSVRRVRLKLKQVGTISSGDVWVGVYSDSTGLPNEPSGQQGSDSEKQDATLIPSTAVEVEFVFTSAISLSASTAYHVVLEGDYTQSDSNYIAWELDDDDATYADGDAEVKDSSWAALDAVNDDDFYFKIRTGRGASYAGPLRQHDYVGFETGSATQKMLTGRTDGESYDRFQLYADGDTYWGGGSGALDTRLYRDSADSLTTPDDFNIGGDLNVTGAASLGNYALEDGEKLYVGTGNPMYLTYDQNTENETLDTPTDVELRLATGSPNNIKLAQEFQVPDRTVVKEVVLSLKEVGTITTGDIWVGIYADDTGLPDEAAQQGSNSATVTASSVGASYEEVTFTFSTGITLTASTAYHVVLEGDYTESDSNYIAWQMDDAGDDDYANGDAEIKDGSWAASGSNDDFWFQVDDDAIDLCDELGNRGAVFRDAGSTMNVDISGNLTTYNGNCFVGYFGPSNYCIVTTRGNANILMAGHGTGTIRLFDDTRVEDSDLTVDLDFVAGDDGNKITYDESEQLLVTEYGLTVQVQNSSDLVFKLADAAGADRLIVTDSADSEVGSITSDGYLNVADDAMFGSAGYYLWWDQSGQVLRAEQALILQSGHGASDHVSVLLPDSAGNYAFRVFDSGLALRAMIDSLGDGSFGMGVAADGRISFGADKDVYIHNEYADQHLMVVAPQGTTFVYDVFMGTDADINLSAGADIIGPNSDWLDFDANDILEFETNDTDAQFMLSTTAQNVTLSYGFGATSLTSTSGDLYLMGTNPVTVYVGDSDTATDLYVYGGDITASSSGNSLLKADSTAGTAFPGLQISHADQNWWWYLDGADDDLCLKNVTSTLFPFVVRNDSPSNALVLASTGVSTVADFTVGDDLTVTGGVVDIGTSGDNWARITSSSLATSGLELRTDATNASINLRANGTGNVKACYYGGAGGFAVYNGSNGILASIDDNSGALPAHLHLESPNGTNWYLFVEDDGTVKVHSAVPTQNSDGSVVGAQT
jgi:hypothetical protein